MLSWYGLVAMIRTLMLILILWAWWLFQPAITTYKDKVDDCSYPGTVIRHVDRWLHNDDVHIICVYPSLTDCLIWAAKYFDLTNQYSPKRDDVTPPARDTEHQTKSNYKKHSWMLSTNSTTLVVYCLRIPSSKLFIDDVNKHVVYQSSQHSIWKTSRWSVEWSRHPAQNKSNYVHSCRVVTGEDVYLVKTELLNYVNNYHDNSSQRNTLTLWTSNYFLPNSCRRQINY